MLLYQPNRPNSSIALFQATSYDLWSPRCLKVLTVMSYANLSHYWRGQAKSRGVSLPLMMAALTVLMAGCGLMPKQNSVLTVQVWEVFGKVGKHNRQLKPSELDQLRAAGVSNDDIAAGRVVGVHCAVMTDGWWEGIATLPAGLFAVEGTTMRVRVIDSGNNERLGVNEFVELLPQLPRGGQAYRFVPNWRELGRRNNFERIELPVELREKYLIVQGSYLLKCKP